MADCSCGEGDRGEIPLPSVWLWLAAACVHRTLLNSDLKTEYSSHYTHWSGMLSIRNASYTKPYTLIFHISHLGDRSCSWLHLLPWNRYAPSWKADMLHWFLIRKSLEHSTYLQSFSTSNRAANIHFTFTMKPWITANFKYFNSKLISTVWCIWHAYWICLIILSSVFQSLLPARKGSD